MYTQQTRNVITTSQQHHDAAATLYWHCCYTVCLLGYEHSLELPIPEKLRIHFGTKITKFVFWTPTVSGSTCRPPYYRKMNMQHVKMCLCVLSRYMYLNSGDLEKPAHPHVSDLYFFLYLTIVFSIPWFCKLGAKTRFDSSCKLSPVETICMSYHRLVSGKNKKNISKWCLLKFIPAY